MASKSVGFDGEVYSTSLYFIRSLYASHFETTRKNVNHRVKCRISVKNYYFQSKLWSIVEPMSSKIHIFVQFQNVIPNCNSFCLVIQQFYCKNNRFFGKNNKIIILEKTYSQPLNNDFDPKFNIIIIYNDTVW